MTAYEPIESPDATTIFPYHDLTPPTTRDIYAAQQVVSQYLPRTPLVRSEFLSDELNADVFLKREDTLPTGAFKVRGGINFGYNLDPEFQNQGLIAASTGNHGQSVAYAGRIFDVSVIVAVPEGPNPDKVAAMEQLDARVERHGSDYDEAREWAETQATKHGYRYVHSANEPMLIAGVGTAGLEIVEDQPAVDTIFCPVGGGSSAAGYCLTAGAITGADVIGVQSRGADATYHAWHEGHLEPQDVVETMAEGIASRVPFALTMDVLRDYLYDLVRVSESAIRDSVDALFTQEHIIAEGASAAAVAAARNHDDVLTGQTVVIPISGRNISSQQLLDIVDD